MGSTSCERHAVLQVCPQLLIVAVTRGEDVIQPKALEPNVCDHAEALQASTCVGLARLRCRHSVCFVLGG
eukprot:356133-Chlamydomonas_euryale.AAC.30